MYRKGDETTYSGNQNTHITGRSEQHCKWKQRPRESNWMRMTVPMPRNNVLHHESSREVTAKTKSTIIVLHAAAALAVANSPDINKTLAIRCAGGIYMHNLCFITLNVRSTPWGCANCWLPVGATKIGDDILYPNNVVDISILLTSTRILGLNLNII